MSKSISFRTLLSPKFVCDTVFEGESRTKQASKAECDINAIMKRYEATGLISHISSKTEPLYGDFTDVTDFQYSVDRVNNAYQSFMSLPSSIRTRFNNEPAHLMNFLADSNNYDEAVRLGIIAKKENTDFSKKSLEVASQPDATSEVKSG